MGAGVPPYSFEWSNGTFGDLDSNLHAGTYTVTVTDALGATATRTATVPTVNVGQLAMGNTSYGSPFIVANWVGQPDPYCPGGDPDGPFFRIKIYDSERWVWGLAPGLYPALATNGGYVNPQYYDAMASGTEGFMEYLFPIPGGQCGDGLVPVTIGIEGGCSGTVMVRPGCPLQWPTVDVVEVEPSCSNYGTGTVRLHISGVPYPVINLQLFRMGSLVRTINGVTDGEQLIENLSAGDYEVRMKIYPPTDYWEQYCPFTPITLTVPSMGMSCGQVKGSVFMDYNLNCTKQTNEPLVPGAVLKIEPGPYYTNTNHIGEYKAYLPVGSYTIEQVASTVNAHCPGAPQAFTISAGGTQTIRFADTSLVMLDLSVYNIMGPARPGFTMGQWLRVRNTTPTNSGTLTVSLHFDEVLGFVEAEPAPASVGTDVITWQLPDLAGFSTVLFNVAFQVPADVGLLGHVLHSVVTAIPANEDADMDNNAVAASMPITGSYDPNDKLALTNTGSAQYWVNGQDEWVDYTIRIQNTGTDTAFHVIVTDTLPASLDPGTLEIGAVSHPVSWKLSDQGILRCTFTNIQLPDSNVNEPKSHGYVGFRIKPHQGLAPGTLITNKANIFFDFNPPVITDPCVLEVVPPPVRLDVRAFLGGSYDPPTGLMRDDLRAGGLLPWLEPYSALGYVHAGDGGGETVAPLRFNATVSEAIVDWVVLELRDAGDPATVLHSKSALLRRDGKVVATDGRSAVSVRAASGNYYVALRHRNHLGVMTAAPVSMTLAPTTINFTGVGTATWGSNARVALGGKRGLWPGDANFDGRVKYTGPGNDRDKMLQAIGGGVPTATQSGYNGSDVNMDGVVKYAGPGNDRDVILQVIGSEMPTAVRQEQLPQ